MLSGDRDALEVAREVDAAVHAAQHAFVEERLRDLLDEERVAVGLLRNEARERLGEPPGLEDGAGHGARLAARERL